MNNLKTASLDSCPKLGPHVVFHIDPITKNRVLLYPEGVLFLNVGAEEIIRRCDGETSILAIIAELSYEYDTDPDQIHSDILYCLNDLSQRKLLCDT